nr:serine/threonine-protein kinase [Pseudenhygromyxa sp. WMMC2535]
MDEILELGEGAPPLILAQRYRLERRLGEGGMAAVFLAEHVGLGRRVAVKVLGELFSDRHHATARFMREARLSARIRHRNVVEVFDFGSTPEGVLFLVMELLEGGDLRAKITQNPEGLPWAVVRGLILQVCRGVAAIHAAGVVHRDIKPENCYVTLDERGREAVKIVDLGVAARVGSKGEGKGGAEDSERISEDGVIVGTPEYMAPEQACGGVDARSDIYALGVLLGELLTGKVPFTGKSRAAVIKAQMKVAPVSLEALAGRPVDATLAAIYARALAKNPAQRFQSVEALAEALAAVSLDADLSQTPPAESSHACEARELPQAQGLRGAAPRALSARHMYVRSLFFVFVGALAATVGALATLWLSASAVGAEHTPDPAEIVAESEGVP